MHEGSEATHLIVLGIAFLVAAVVSVPIFKRLGLGSVLGYLFAGVVLERFGLVQEPQHIMEFAELGVVFLLFLIGLELNPKRLWSMRRDIFGLGALQIVLCGALLMTYPLMAGRSFEVALVAGLGLALSSTALVMQIIDERGALARPYGQKTFAVLLMQDIAIVPLLVLVTLLSAGGEDVETGALAISVLQALAAVGAVVVVGHYLLSPAFRILSRFGGREIMTAAALLTVLASGYLLVVVGLSMAMGAFLAGVLLAESNYRHELEADIEPFRGLLLGLFFLSVGMSLDLNAILQNWLLILGGMVFLIILKAVVVYGLVRLFSGDHLTGVKTAILLSQGGEFGFVLFSAAAAQGVISQPDATSLIATVILSMVTTPFLINFLPPLLIRERTRETPEETFEGADGDVLIVGFGRFGQLVSQMMLAGGKTPILLDSDPDRILEARRFGNRVYFGDGRRLDVLRAAGAETCRLIAVCTDNRDDTNAIVDLCKTSFPHALIYARAFDRRHALTLLDKNADYQRRETFDGAVRFGHDALAALGASAYDADEAEALVRKRDQERLEFQRLEGFVEGYRKWREVTPEPYTRREREDKPSEPPAEAAE